MLPEIVPGPYSMESLESKNRTKTYEKKGTGAKIWGNNKRDGVGSLYKYVYESEIIRCFFSWVFLLLVAFLIRKKVKPVTFGACINLVRHTKFSL